MDLPVPTGSCSLPLLSVQAHLLYIVRHLSSPGTLCTNVSVGARPATDWKRPPGRPRWSWLQQLEEDHGQKVDVIRTAALDRLH